MAESKESIFRAYDVRGKYPEQINEKTAYLIGRAFAELFKGRVAVGGDARLSTPSIKDALIKGLTQGGVDVVDIGMAPTPIVYYACYGLQYDYGIAITGSHLGKEFNGMKFCYQTGIPISYEDGIEKIKDLVEKNDFPSIRSSQRGKVTRRDINEDYIDFILSLFPKKLSHMKIVVDGANGSSGKVYSEALRRAGAEVIELYCDPDGNFPNHSPDPMKGDNIKDLEEKVKEHEADMGMAFDGDGDRINFVDEEGKAVDSNHIFSIMIEDALKKDPNGIIVHDVLCSKLIDDVIERSGGKSITWRVGHTYIAKKCFDESAVMAGEVSGHYFFKEANYADDVLIAGFKVANVMLKKGRRLSDIVSGYPYFFKFGDRLPVSENEKFDFVDRLKQSLVSQGLDIMTMDGVRVNFENGWMLFRPSNTEAKISMGYESSDKDEFERIKQMADSIISTIPQ